MSVPMWRATSNAFSIDSVVEVVPAEQPRHEQQVAARRDRQELRQPLHEPEDDGVQDRHGGFYRLRRARHHRPIEHGRCRPRSGGQAPLIVTSRMTRLTPAARIGSQSTSPPTSTMSSSIRCSVEAIVSSRTGAPTVPLVISIPEAPVEKSPLTGLTPECRPDTDCTSSPSSTSATSVGLVAGARLQLQGEAADARRAGEAAAGGVAGRDRAGAAGRVAGVDELPQHAALDEDVAPGGQALAVDVGGGVGVAGSSGRRRA